MPRPEAARGNCWQGEMLRSRRGGAAGKPVDRLISGPVGQTTTSWQVDKLTRGQGIQRYKLEARRLRGLVEQNTSSGLGSQVIGYRVRVREMKCKGATAAEPRAKVQK